MEIRSSDRVCPRPGCLPDGESRGPDAVVGQVASHLLYELLLRPSRQGAFFGHDLRASVTAVNTSVNRNGPRPLGRIPRPGLTGCLLSPRQFTQHEDCRVVSRAWSHQSARKQTSVRIPGRAKVSSRPDCGSSHRSSSLWECHAFGNPEVVRRPEPGIARCRGVYEDVPGTQRDGKQPTGCLPVEFFFRTGLECLR